MNTQDTSPSKTMRPFLVLWSGQAVSLLGSQLVQFALIWWLTQETGSATVLAMASLIGLLPQVILGPFVGVLVDRWNRRLTMLLADSLVAAATLALAYLFSTGAVEIWHIYLLLFVRSLGGAFHWPAMMASTTLMVPEEHLTRIQGLNQMLNGGMNIASAPLGALLLALLPLQGILAIDVVTALFAIVPLLFIYVPQPQKNGQSEAEEAPTSSYWTDLREGLRYVLDRKALLMLMLMAMLVNLLLTPTFAFMPLLITDHFSGTAWHLGAIDAAAGIGMLVGGFVLSLWGGFKRRILTTLIGLLCLGLSLVFLGLIPANLFILAVAVAVVAGFTIPMIDGPIMAILQAIVAPDMQGRVFTLLGSLSKGMTPLGLMIAGPVADIIGVRSWFVMGGLVTAVLAIASFLMSPVLHIEDGAHQPVPQSDDQPLATMPASSQVPGA
ncbi:MAG: MFS transporter [Chloroflexi bacterium]|nr:MFS transporter [Chloroflexota bacterium]